MTITTGSFTKSLWPGVNKWYGDEYKEFPVEYTNMFSTHSSKKAFEEDVGISGFGLAQVKAEGGAIAYDTALQGFIDRYTHVTWGLGFVITREAYEDDLYDVVGKKKAKSLAFSMRQTKEINAANILNRAFNASYTYGDGSALCVSNHANVAGGTWSNIMATAADLSEAALEQAFIDIQGYTNDRGLKIAVMPRKLIVPYQLDFEANKILQTEFEVGTNNNTKNIVRGRLPGGVVISHYLTDADAWFIVTDIQDGLKYFERRGDDFGMDEDFDTDNAKYKATARYSFGCTDKRGIYGTPGA